MVQGGKHLGGIKEQAKERGEKRSAAPEGTLWLVPVGPPKDYWVFGIRARVGMRVVA